MSDAEGTLIVMLSVGTRYHHPAGVVAVAVDAVTGESIDSAVMKIDDGTIQSVVANSAQGRIHLTVG